jgi:hypothetical protein
VERAAVCLAPRLSRKSLLWGGPVQRPPAAVPEVHPWAHFAAVPVRNLGAAPETSDDAPLFIGPQVAGAGVRDFIT